MINGREITHLIRLLNQIANHDWRVSFLAHTSDTAYEAAQMLARLTAELTRLREREKELSFDDRDWDTLLSYIPEDGRGRFFRERLLAVKALSPPVSAGEPSGPSQDNGEMT